MIRAHALAASAVSRTRPITCRHRARVLGLAALVLAAWAILGAPVAHADDGLLGIDKRWTYDNRGIWRRSYQDVLQYGLIAGELGVGLWEGGEDRFGHTMWQSIDASLISGIASAALKRAFSRERPHETADPDQWFSGSGRSFPSGEVTETSSIVTPFVLEYGREHPAVYLLELLPAYDAVARMKTQGHWQSDVIAGFVLGTTTAYFLHKRKHPLVLGFMPHGVYVGLKAKF